MIAQVDSNGVQSDAFASRRGRMRKDHATVISSVKPRLTQRAEQLLSGLLRDIVPLIAQESVIAKIHARKEHTPKRRERGKQYAGNPVLSQAEKVLVRLIDGKPVPIEELKKKMKREVETYRLSAYLWDLKQIGADVQRIKRGRKIVSLKLKNVQRMKSYLDKRLSNAA